MVLQGWGEQHEALSLLSATSEVTLSTEAGGLAWGLPTGKQGWSVVHKVLGAGQGLGAVGWTQGFDVLKWDKTGCGCRQRRGRRERWWSSVQAWQVEKDP